MRLLIDSHVALWWLDGNEALGPSCRADLENADEVFFSAVTPWELGIKRSLGKLSFPDGLVEALEQSGFVGMPIGVDQAVTASELPPHHRDPFDRLLVAQARSAALSLVTADRTLAPYEVELLDARA